VKILIVTPSMPYPPIWGFSIRVHNFIKELSRRHEVSLLCYTEPGEDDGSVEPLGSLGVAVQTVPRPDDRGPGLRKRQLRSLLSARSFHSGRVWSAEMQRAINETLDQHRFDVVQVESSRLAVFDFGRHSGAILDEHNLEYELLQRIAQAERFWPRKVFSRLESAKVQREEQSSWRRFGRCIVTSERERQTVIRHSAGVATAVVPNGVDVDYFQPARAAVDPDSIVFTGLMTYRPNADAAVHFVREVLPLVRRSRPRARFTAVGWGLPKDLAPLLGDGVRHTGRVPDVRPFLAQAAAVVVPLRMGSGTRLKVLEALAMGKGVVSTTLGCEGVDVTPGQDLLVADDPPSFAAAVVELMEDAERREALGYKGRRLVERSYTWPAVVARLERFYEQQIRRPIELMHAPVAAS
jgi:sugar transferase (PEP-CTERM/EpsH1 system associated)